jgi:hypothetical protein
VPRTDAEGKPSANLLIWEDMVGLAHEYLSALAIIEEE